ncbi:MAG: type II secretion system F family protein [Candidatus Omnitrophica bacterium]|nr:type II secretion system F family protein [Candidatus Omnitrophota bacterium]
MAYFRYEIVDHTGKKMKGIMEARDRASLINSFKKSQYVIISLTEIKELYTRKRAKIKLADLVLFTRQLAALIKAGVSLVKSLDILFAQVENRYLKEVISSMTARIQAGASLSGAMATYPEIFSSLYLNMIKAGEFSGSLDVVLERLASYLEGMIKLARKVKSAMIYPAVVITVAMLITAVIFLKVIPGFEEIFSSLQARLPIPTRIALRISRFFRENLLYILGGLIILIGALRGIIHLPKIRLFLDRSALKAPVVGRIIRKVVIARFTRTLSTLVKSGISIIPAIETSAKTSGNIVVEQALNKIANKVSKGEKIADSMAEYEIFSPMVINLIGVGEETGDISTMLDKVASFYEEEVDVAVSNLTSLIEPFIIVFLGVIIGGIVLAMFLPILQITQIIGR